MSFVKTEFEASAYEPAQLIQSDLPEVVFSGKSNVGKSSLINKLANRKSLARVSSAPGKTASVNFYHCGPFRLVDLPGYGYAKISAAEKEKWSELVEGFFNGGRSIRLVVQLLDARHDPTQNDLDMIRYLKDRQMPFIVAATKSDKLSRVELLQRQERLPLAAGVKAENVIFCSVSNASGIPELEERILRYCI